MQPAKLLAQLSLAALLLSLIASAARLIASLRRSETPFAIGWMLAAFALYLPFIVWWEPFEPKWFVVPNVFLAGALAVLWRRAHAGERRFLWTCVAVIAAANFSNAVWPRRTQLNPNLSLARCVAQHLRPTDLFVVSDWEWFNHAEYFYDYAGSSLWLIDRRGRESKLGAIAGRIDGSRRAEAAFARAPKRR